MGEKHSKLKIFASKKNSVVTSSTSSLAIRQRRRMSQNYLVIWVDGSVDQPNQDNQHTLEQLRSVVKEIKLCTTSTQCIEFLKNMNGKKALVISSGALGQHLVLQIHDMPHVDAIYIFCGDESRHKSWVKKWSKIQGVFTSIAPICDSLRKITGQCNHNVLLMSVAPQRVISTALSPSDEQNLEQSESSFT
ncbi:unnamed protein product [Rotaria sp. Silwood2]|nr:unnamed protein product [Rotaria sp. Silwood2]CAF2470585.1 unnamed protein product [Rotaria sp. Silwood2]CAF2858463.1 unnamed protein product [Rotaria sp. Silwood2]CAF3857833.1 unnamed protein product [Rotaria sp. Silwood2]CAF4012245.1 unnamed protein product [Rotaria sp. Silwood2]